ncbi:hypothetical protein GCM10010191_44690 [Actinomadura vinacea]|uniref:Uncharacterized protein n=1 Tax=Actinomadura vinacea TaxID=115336 RepID=A0ABN3JD37_9ACTN
MAPEVENNREFIRRHGDDIEQRVKAKLTEAKQLFSADTHGNYIGLFWWSVCGVATAAAYPGAAEFVELHTQSQIDFTRSVGVALDNVAKTWKGADDASEVRGG